MNICKYFNAALIPLLLPYTHAQIHTSTYMEEKKNPQRVHEFQYNSSSPHLKRVLNAVVNVSTSPTT